MTWTWKDTCAIGVMVLAVAVFFFRLFWPASQIIITPDFGQSDAVSAIATKFIYSSKLSEHRIPLWTSMIGGGYPIFALGTMAAFFLPNLIFFSLFNPITAYNITLVLSVVLTGWGMYVWLRLMGYRRTACLYGSITIVLSGYVIAQLTHITIVQTYCLFPWLAALTLRLARKKSWYAVGWFILLLSQQIFVGFPQSVFITLFFLATYWVWLKPKNILFIVAVCSGCIAGAAQLLPSLEYSKTLTTANGFTPDQATTFSYPFKHLLTLINPFALGNPALGTYPYFSRFGGSIFWENTAYIGIIPVLCLIIAAWKKIPIKPMMFFIFTLAVSFLLMTGGNSPLYFIYSFWPFNIFRVPSRFIWLFEIAFLVVSIHAFDRITGHLRKTAFLVIFIQLIMLFTIWWPYHLLTPTRDWLKTPPLAAYIDRSHYTISIGAEHLYNSLHVREKEPSSFLRNTLTPDKSILWNVPQIGDYTGRTIRRSGVLTDLLHHFITSDESDATISASGQKFLTMLSVKNVISTFPLTQQGLSPKTHISYAGHTIDLYENPEALPSVYFAKKAIPVHTVEEAVRELLSDTFVPGDDVLVESEPTPAATLIRGTVEIISSGEGEYVARVINPNDQAILVLTQSYYPGWRATINRKGVSVFPVNIKHIGVLVPKGNHVVEFRYLPNSFVSGAWVSGIALGVTIFLMAFGFFRSLWHTHQKAVSREQHLRRNLDRSSLHT